MASAYLPFWPKAAAMAYVAAGTTEDIYSKVLPTNGFTEIVIQFECDAPICGDANTTIDLVPQISNDGVNWEDQTAPNFTAITQASSFPTKEVAKFTEVAAFMRLKIEITQSTASSNNAGATLHLAGTGRT